MKCLSERKLNSFAFASLSNAVARRRQKQSNSSFMLIFVTTERIWYLKEDRIWLFIYVAITCTMLWYDWPLYFVSMKSIIRYPVNDQCGLHAGPTARDAAHLSHGMSWGQDTGRGQGRPSTVTIVPFLWQINNSYNRTIDSKTEWSLILDFNKT